MHSPFFNENTAIVNIALSDNAKARIRFLLNKENNSALFLRVSVLGGGCSGYQYEFKLDDKKEEEDTYIFDTPHAPSLLLAAIDSISLPLLKDAIIDYKETLESAEFIVKNPNATAMCGCGNSFTL